MNEKNVNQRLLIIGIVVVLAAFLLRDPRQTLRPGLDIAGGTSLIFEIDTTDAEKVSDLAERVKEHLQRRVDPKGVYDLSWRVQGRNRLEVQMPLPPEDAKRRLKAYRAALDALFEPSEKEGGQDVIHEIMRGRLERALRETGEARAAAIERLAERNAPEALKGLSGPDATAVRAAIEQGVAERKSRILVAAEKYDAYVTARAALEKARAEMGAQAASKPPESAEAASQPTSMPAGLKEVSVEPAENAYLDALEEYEDAVTDVLDTNLNRRRFQEVLDLDAGSAVQTQSLGNTKKLIDAMAKGDEAGVEANIGDFQKTHRDLESEINAVIAAHATWREGRRFLDGPSDLKRLLRGSGRLEFRILAEPSTENPTKYDRYRAQLTKEGVRRRPGDDYGWFKVDNAMQFFNLDTQADVESFRKNEKYKSLPQYVVDMLGEDYYVLADMSPTEGLLHNVPGQRQWKLTRAIPDRDQQGRWCVRFRLDVVGGQMFGDLTQRNINRPLCILVDDVAYSAPNINSKITTDGEITGEFSLDKVSYLVRTMEGGTLPARLKDTPLSERTIGSSLGEANRDMAVRAGLIGAAAIVLLMLSYYLFVCGSIANVALLMNVFLILSAMAMLNARITLVGIAGIILSIGMAVDANVLVFERMREEKERGTSLRLIVKNGYDKALSTIFDSNITTLLTCIIIYYVGSEEVKGFGLTLGWGIVLNLFTSVFVTRTLFGFLLKYNMIKNIGMLKLIGVPNIDWYAKRKFFIPMSLCLIVLGVALLVDRGYRNVMDVEFLGGVAAEFELNKANMNDAEIKKALDKVGTEFQASAEKLPEATVEPVAGQPGVFALRVPGVDATRVAAMVTEPLEEGNLLERGGVTLNPEQDVVMLAAQSTATADLLTSAVHGLKDTLVDAGKNLGGASVNAVLDVEGVQEQGLIWNVTTTVTNMHVVEQALVDALPGNMRIQPRVTFTMQGVNDRPYPITDRQLDTVIPSLPEGVAADLTDYLGGAAIYLVDLDPPISAEALNDRLENMLFQPDFQDVPRRPFQVIGVARSGDRKDANGRPEYSSVVIATGDPDIRYSDDPEQWYNGLVVPQLRLINTALSSEQTLRKVMQFKPQIAARSTQQASLALLLSWAMIIGYLWIRFGRPMYGVAGVVALVHDVLIALAFVGISGWIGGQQHPIGNALLITDFKINMTIVAALLTIIGYSINDTIVVFDRIRETRGRLGVVTPDIINASINQTLSRTIMTSLTTLVVLVIAYIFGGSSIRGFNFCMIVGILTGSYSSIVIAAPLLMFRLLGGSKAAARGR